ncbi:asparagine synthase-related protein [Streptomyces sp. TRM 70351]|uniref:asparagine synthase-related protein n=1 Tax=Streptomyces sp. TRM 70351 TaxID=3116552 RepID=UPI002E7B396E|nr:asparagine synthase-related protein [Streptomyces sp. TRM 70351]MEE1930691.1 asparagine synthase-related protein [Streptomyces sp. TRM 70351]
MRFIAGTCDTGRGSWAGNDWRPRGARDALNEGPARIWTTGFEPGEVRRCSDRNGQAEVLAIGCCLATREELSAARADAERGAWAQATRLPGSFLTVVRDRTGLRIAGDRAGTVTVYWIRVREGVLWATAAAPLAAFAKAQPNFAVLLSMFMVRGVDVLAADSHFRTVRRVPPGHVLVLAPGRQPRTEAVPALTARTSIEEGATAVRETITTAVGRRATSSGPISSDLSGGVDSGTVTTLAATRGPLLAVTYTDARMSEQDDMRYAERIAHDHPQITHTKIHGARAGVQHFDGLEDPAVLPFTDTPSFTLGLLAIKAAQLAPATAHGSRAHLTGRGGDDVLDAVPTMAIDQYRAGHRMEALRRTATLVRTRRAALWPVLEQAARTQRTRYPQALAALADTINAGPEHTAQRGPGTPVAQLLTWCGSGSAAAWLTRTGRAAVADLVTARAQTARPDTTPGALHERLALELMGDGHATFDQISRQQWGLPVHAPLLDNPVVNACHAIPGYARTQPGDFKPLARAAFPGHVPDYLLHRRTKTAFTSSLFTGLRANAPVLRRILGRSLLAQAGLLDRSKALASLDSAARGEPAPLAALHALIVTELWLATLSTARTTWWETTTARTQNVIR